MRKKLAVLVFLLLALLSVVACTPGDPISDLYTMNLYPGTTDTYDVGSAALRYDTGFFREIWLNGAMLVPGVVVETDPVFTASPAFGITAGNITGWNSHPGLTTGTHGVTGTIVGTSDAQSLTNKNLTMDNNVPVYWDNTVGTDVNVLNLWADDNLHILDGENSEIFVWLGSVDGGMICYWHH